MSDVTISNQGLTPPSPLLNIASTPSSLSPDDPTFPHPDMNRYLGPDKPGKSILTVIIIFLLVAGLVFWGSSHVVRDIPFTISAILPTLIQTETDLYNNLFTIPISIIILTPYTTVSAVSQDDTNKLTQSIEQHILPALINSLIFPQDQFHNELSFQINIQIIQSTRSSFSDLHLNDLDDYFQENFFQNMSMDILRYIFIPHDLEPTSTNHHFTFYTGKYTHAMAFYPSLLLRETSPPTSLLSILPKLTSAHQFTQSLVDTIWLQVQPSLLVLTPSFKAYIKEETASTNAHSKFHTTNRRFQAFFGISIQDYLTLRIPTQSTYQLDFTLLHHSPLLNEYESQISALSSSSHESSSPQQIYMNTMYQTNTQSQPSLNTTLLNEALSILQTTLQPAISLRITTTTSHLSTILSTPSPQLIKLSSNMATSLMTDFTLNNDQKNAHKAKTNDHFNFFSLDTAQLQSLATKNLPAWKRSTDMTPSSPSDYLIGPPKVLNFVALHPNLSSYSSHCTSPSISQDIKDASTNSNIDTAGSNIHNIIVLEPTGTNFLSASKFTPNSNLSFSQITSSLLNTAQIPQWGTASLIPPAIGSYADCQNEGLNHNLTQNQQKDIIHTFITNFKLILGISPPYPQSPLPTRTSLDTISNNHSQDSHPSSLIPLPLWQRHLFFRFSSWGLYSHISTTIQSIGTLLKDATHMPFPTHLASLYSTAYRLITTSTPTPPQFTSIHPLSSHAQDNIKNGTNALNISLQTTFTSFCLANQLSHAVFYHSDLLPQLFFPLDQLTAIYAPFFAPIIVPIFTAAFKLLFRWIQDKRKKKID